MALDSGIRAGTGTKAASFNEREMQICTVARMVDDGKTYWVAGGGSPMYAALLGIKLYAPNAQYITEDGCIAPSVSDGQEERFPGGLRREVIPDAGHWPHRERADVVTPLIVDWLRG